MAKNNHRTLTTKDMFYELPDELVKTVLSYLLVVEVASYADTSLFYNHFTKECYMPLMTKFCLKQQSYIAKGLSFWMQHASKMQGLYIDNRAAIERSRDWNGSLIQDKSMPQSSFCHFSRLNTLVLRSCAQLTSKTFNRIAQSTGRLTTLDLSHMISLKSETLQKIFEKNTGLTYLCLERSYPAVHDQCLKTLGENCPQLRTLSLAHCVLITGVGLNYVSEGCTLLKEVSLAHCYEVDSASLCNLARRCNGIKILTLEWCLHMDDDVVSAMALYCQDLQVLGIENCERVSDHALAQATPRFHSLRFLSADSCKDLGPALLLSIASYQGGMTDLFLNKCLLVSDSEVEIVAKNCAQLSSIGIEECSVTDTGVLALGTHCKALKVVGLNGNHITDASMIKLLQALPCLERLYISHTHISNATLRAAAQHSRHLISLSVLECHVDGSGLLALGETSSACRESLRDLHISAYLTLSYNFYAGRGGHSQPSSAGSAVPSPSSSSASSQQFQPLSVLQPITAASFMTPQGQVTSVVEDVGAAVAMVEEEDDAIGGEADDEDDGISEVSTLHDSDTEDTYAMDENDEGDEEEEDEQRSVMLASTLSSPMRRASVSPVMSPNAGLRVTIPKTQDPQNADGEEDDDDDEEIAGVMHGTARLQRSSSQVFTQQSAAAVVTPTHSRKRPRQTASMSAAQRPRAQQAGGMPLFPECQQHSGTGSHDSQESHIIEDDEEDNVQEDEEDEEEGGYDDHFMSIDRQSQSHSHSQSQLLWAAQAGNQPVVPTFTQTSAVSAFPAGTQTTPPPPPPPSQPLIIDDAGPDEGNPLPPVFGAASYATPQPSSAQKMQCPSPPSNSVLLNLEDVIFPYDGNKCRVYVR